MEDMGKNFNHFIHFSRSFGRLRQQGRVDVRQKDGFQRREEPAGNQYPRIGLQVRPQETRLRQPVQVGQ